MDTTAALIAATLGAATPLLLAAIGLLVNERSGVLNLGAEVAQARLGLPVATVGVFQGLLLLCLLVFDTLVRHRLRWTGRAPRTC